MGRVSEVGVGWGENSDGGELRRENTADTP